MPRKKLEQSIKDWPHETLAESITKISSALVSLKQSGLNRRGIVALVRDKTKMPKDRIVMVLDALEDLKKDYCR